jgi:hypothetical protein
MVRFHAALEMTWKQRAHPCVSTGRSIHAMLNIARAGEGAIDDGPSLRLRTRPKAVVFGRRQPEDRSAVALAGAAQGRGASSASLVSPMSFPQRRQPDDGLRIALAGAPDGIELVETTLTIAQRVPEMPLRFQNTLSRGGLPAWQIRYQARRFH